MIEDRKQDYDVKVDGYGRLAWVLTLFEVDCDGNRMRMLTQVDYAADGEVLNSFTYHTDVMEWKAVVPDSIGETFAEQACKYSFFDDIPPAKPKPKTSRHHE